MSRFALTTAARALARAHEFIAVDKHPRGAKGLEGVIFPAVPAAKAICAFYFRRRERKLVSFMPNAKRDISLRSEVQEHLMDAVIHVQFRMKR